ncbi:MAG: hypothetical protein ABI995_14355, partial [Acidobacteriota bacterium]
MRITRLISTMLLGALCGSYAAAQNCSNSSVTGAYGYLATFAAPGSGTGAGIAPPPPVPFSTSPVGTLLSGVMGTTGLSSSSSFYFDGNGGIWSTATATAPAQFISGT